MPCYDARQEAHAHCHCLLASTTRRLTGSQDPAYSHTGIDNARSTPSGDCNISSSRTSHWGRTSCLEECHIPTRGVSSLLSSSCKCASRRSALHTEQYTRARVRHINATDSVPGVGFTVSKNATPLIVAAFPAACICAARLRCAPRRASGTRKRSRGGLSEYHCERCT